MTVERVTPAAGAARSGAMGETSSNSTHDNTNHGARHMSHNTQVQQVRQGDVFLSRVQALPANAKPVARDAGRVVLAYGEVTGHAHVIEDAPTDQKAALYDDGEGGFYLAVEDPCGLVHEEHARIDLAPGTYRVTRQREWSDADEPIQVAD